MQFMLLDNLIKTCLYRRKEVTHHSGSKFQLLDWGEYGFRMHFPQDTILHEEYCEVTILALMGGEFQLPMDTELVSAVFSISFQKKIYDPVVVHMQHCVLLETEWRTTQLCFVATCKGHFKEDNVFDYRKRPV